MIGPIVAVAIATLTGMRTAVWTAGRNTGMVVVGTALGLYFTPEAVNKIVSYLPLIAIATGSTVLIGVAASAVLTKAARIDRATAFFCSVPGGVAEMSILGERFGASPVPIAVAQLLRIVFLVFTLPSVMMAAGVTGDIFTAESKLPFDISGLAVLLGVSAAVTLALVRLRARNAWLLGPLGVGILVSISGYELSSVPISLTSAAQILIGTHLGSAFRRNEMFALRRVLPAIAGNIFILAFGCAVLGSLIALVSGEPLATLILATAPGGVTEMCLTAKTLKLDVALIVAFHVLRIFVVLLATPWVFLAMRNFGLIAESSLMTDAETTPTTTD
ncbi:hypothetical protein GR328_24070 [Microvirga makkahensis]|uniref:Ammonia monooxygenase n=2 Tax=Microvirga makkahensis TaxID=1128670 RepID=A0A7X3MWX5_9HYPH|nr:hypothetical protein [Microvirga makkahensis]